MISFFRRIFDPKERLRHALSKMTLPVLPTGHMRVLGSLRSDKPIKEVGQEIGLDPALTTSLLRTVNSAAFGLAKRVSSPEHAASLLGRATLESLVLGVVVSSALPRGGDFDHIAFWRASAKRAATSRALAEAISPRDRNTCFTAGLLQDMALPLLVLARPDLYREFMIDDPDGPLLAAREKEHQDFTHAEVGGWLGEVWRFPEELTTAIQGHHTQGEGPVPVVISGLLHTCEGNRDHIIATASDTFGIQPDIIASALDLGDERGDDLARAITQ